MLIHIANDQPWTGEKINGISHPRNIEQLWSAEDLAAVGLKKFIKPKAVVPIETIKADYKRRVDHEAEQRRLQYITPGDGMAMVYREKFEQAQAVEEMGQAAAEGLTSSEYHAAFPLLSADVDTGGVSLWTAAQDVISAYMQFVQVSSEIEVTRLQGKATIDVAPDEAAVKAAYEAISWNTP